MRIQKDAILRAMSYATATVGLVCLWGQKPLLMMLFWLVAILTAFARVLFTHEINYLEDGTHLGLEIFDGFMTTGALVSTIAGLSAIGMGSPSAALSLWIGGFVALQLQLAFTHTRLAKR